MKTVWIGERMVDGEWLPMSMTTTRAGARRWRDDYYAIVRRVGVKAKLRIIPYGRLTERSK